MKEDIVTGLRHEVLIVDDNPANLGLLVGILKEQGYEAKGAISGGLALQAVTATLPDLILLDIKMPIMNGFEVCRRLKGNAATKDIPIVFISALDATEDKKKAFEVGGVDYITKPFEPNEVLARIRTHISLYKITKNLEREVEKRTQQLAQHIQQTPVGVIEWNKDFEITSWNPAAEKIFGFSKEEAIGKRGNIIVPPEFQEFIHSAWLSLVKGESGFALHNENINKKGQRILCDWYNTRMLDDQGNFIGVASLVLNVTAERTALHALIHKEKEQSLLLESMLEGVITVDKSGKIQTFNKAASDMFGYATAEVVGKNINSLILPDRSEIQNEYGDHHIESSLDLAAGEAKEVIGIRKGGQEFFVYLSVSSLVRSDGGEQRFVVCCHDLTELKIKEEQLRKTQKLESLGMLTSGVAHDFNNILGVVSGYAELLSTCLNEEPKLYKYAKEIYRASERGTKLTKRMLSFSKTKAATVRETDINKVVEKELCLIEKTLMPRIRVKVDLQQDLWSVLIDESDLMDALLNLAINASHAIEGSGEFAITTKNYLEQEIPLEKLDIEPGDYVAIIVRDTGGGIPPENLSKIFDPFYTTKEEQGTGLGLSQVYGFVTRSSGGIMVDSQAGQGTVFTLFFPRYIVESHKKGLDSAALTSFPAANTGETILIVDDEPALCDFAKEVLESSGYKVVCKASGADALNFLSRHKAALVLTDIAMPDMDGFELAEQVRALYPKIKLQFTSGCPVYNQGKMSPYIDALIANTLQKPYRAKDLLDCVNRQFQH